MQRRSRLGQHRLPSRPPIHPEEALDGYLERLSAANGLDPAQLLRMLTTPAGEEAPSLGFLMFKPAAETVARISTVSGLPEQSVLAATLTRFGGGLPLHLDGFDPSDRHSFRSVVNQGWFPQTGSQTCPKCIASDGIWRLTWRLPITVACLKHQVFLSACCGGCGFRFRFRRYSPLRPSTNHVCGNQLGLRQHCRYSILDCEAVPAPKEVLSLQRSVEAALAGESTEVMGQKVSPHQYLGELRHVATLLLHLVTRPSGPDRTEWGAALHAEAQARTTELRGPRWGISPPSSAVVRAGALSEARAIVAQSSVEEAAVRLSRWFDLIADVPNGPGNWLVNRTVRTDRMEELIETALIARHDVGRRVSRRRANLPLKAIPQLIDHETYRRVFSGMLGGYEATGRLYVSLCLARAAAAARNWSQAAVALGLEPTIGPRTARAASARRGADPGVFTAAVHDLMCSLPIGRDFRARETRVKQLACNVKDWFEEWRRTTSPARRLGSLPYAITWMWCEVAQGMVATSPAWTGPPDGRARVAYRAFCTALPPAGEEALRALVLGVDSSAEGCDPR